MATVPPEKIRAIKDLLQKQPEAMTAMIAKQAGVPERDVFLVLEGECEWALDPAKFDGVMELLKIWGPVMVIVKNAYAVMESYGLLDGYSRAMGYFNVKSEGIDMHIKSEGIAAMFLVIRPTPGGGMPTHSVQCFDEAGQPIIKVLLPATTGHRPPSSEVQATVERLQKEFALNPKNS